MEQVSNKDRLKNKFSKLEMDFEDERFEYKITSNSVKKIQTNAEIAFDRSFLNIVWRAVKLSAKTGLSYSHFFYTKVVKGLLKFSYSMTKKIAITVREKEEKMEILLDKKITEVELAKKEQEELIDLKVQIQNKLNQVYSKEVKNIFGNALLEHSIDLSNLENEKISNVHVYQLEIFQLMSKKLTASNMILNVKNLNITTHLNSKKMISTKFSCEMEKRGHLWATMFGKHIVPEINKILEKRQGKIMMKQVSHISRIEDFFELTITFNPLEEVSIKSRFSSPIMQRQDF